MDGATDTEATTKERHGVAKGLLGAGVGFEGDALLRYPACVCLLCLDCHFVRCAPVERCYTKHGCMIEFWEGCFNEIIVLHILALHGVMTISV